MDVSFRKQILPSLFLGLSLIGGSAFALAESGSSHSTHKTPESKIESHDATSSDGQDHGSHGGASEQSVNSDPPLPPALTSLFGGSFELQDQTGKTRKDTDWNGKFRLIFFGYTNCPAICPTTLSDITDTLEILGEKADTIQPLFITVDPARDTSEVLADYVESFDERFIALTGTEEQIQHVSKKYRVQRHKILTSEHANHQAGNTGVDDYEAAHSSLTYLMGKDGTFITLFPYGTTPEVMAKRLKPYLDGQSS